MYIVDLIANIMMTCACHAGQSVSISLGQVYAILVVSVLYFSYIKINITRVRLNTGVSE